MASEPSFGDFAQPPDGFSLTVLRTDERGVRANGICPKLFLFASRTVSAPGRQTGRETLSSKASRSWRTCRHSRRKPILHIRKHSILYGVLFCADKKPPLCMAQATLSCRSAAIHLEGRWRQSRRRGCSKVICGKTLQSAKPPSDGGTPGHPLLPLWGNSPSAVSETDRGREKPSSVLHLSLRLA